MSDNHYAPARVADNAGRAQVITASGYRFGDVTVTTPGVSNAWSNWATLTSSVGGSWWMQGCYAKILGLADASLTCHIQGQLAIGAAGSEVPQASFSESFGFYLPAATTSYVWFTRTFLFPPVYVPNAAMLRQRFSVSAAAAYARMILAPFGVPAGFYQRPHPLHRPDMYMRGRTGLAASLAMANFMTLPTPLSQITLTTGNDVFGSWVTVITAAAQTSPLLITGVNLLVPAAAPFPGLSVLLELGIGEAASAIGIEEVKWPNAPSMTFVGGYLPLRRPILLPAGSGLSARAGAWDVGNVTVQVAASPLR